MKGKSLPKWELSKCINAVKRGDIDFLRVYHNNVDPWDKYGLSYKWGMPFICTTAVKFGQLEVLKYLHENRFPWNVETPRTSSVFDLTSAVDPPPAEAVIVTIPADTGDTDKLSPKLIVPAVPTADPLF